MEDYVKNFSEAADMINVKSADDSSPNKMMGFAQALKFRVQTTVTKSNAGNAILNMMKNIKKKRELKEQGINEVDGEEIKFTAEEEDVI